MIDKNSKDLIYLLFCAVNGIVPEQVEQMDLDAIYVIARQHLLSSTISFALQSAGVDDKRIISSIAQALRKINILEIEKEELFAKLEEAKIWYMPLKGAVMKNFYPEHSMREMADYDILYDATRSEEVKIIMESLGFSVERYNTTSNHDVYYKKPVVNFEMHRSLFGVFHEEKLSSYYSGIKNKLIKDEDNYYGYHFTPEDFYVYMIAHEYKHYSRGGTGVRSLLDTFVFLRSNPNLNWEYIDGELKKLGIDNSEQKNKALAIRLFRGEECFDEDDQIFDYMFCSGVYGNITNLVKNNMNKQQKGKIGYIISRIALPMNVVKKAYPFFYKHKILLPILPFYRLLLVRKRGHSTIKAELRVLTSSNRSTKEDSNQA